MAPLFSLAALYTLPQHARSLRRKVGVRSVTSWQPETAGGIEGADGLRGKRGVVF